MNKDHNEEIPAHHRKDAHLDLAMAPLAQADIANSFDRLQLTHCALPEIALAQVDIASDFLGYALSAPLFIGAMTGGTPRADAINAALAEVAQAQKIGLAVGSQRAGLHNGQSLRHMRRRAPDIPLIGNLGGVQLASAKGLDLARAAIEDLQADALAIHVNPLQEAVQPEGETDWRGVLAAIETAVRVLPVPVIVKEVGAGIQAPLVARLFDMGVSSVDVAGLGGTNWARIEAARRADGSAAVFEPFLDWGIPTLDCLLQAAQACPNNSLIASGGVRHGLDAAKALWAGASMVSLAGPMLKALSGALSGGGVLAREQTGAGAQVKALEPARLAAMIDGWRAQIALALFLTGSADIAAFRRCEAVIRGGG